MTYLLYVSLCSIHGMTIYLDVLQFLKMVLYNFQHKKPAYILFNLHVNVLFAWFVCVYVFIDSIHKHNWFLYIYLEALLVLQVSLCFCRLLNVFYVGNYVIYKHRQIYFSHPTPYHYCSFTLLHWPVPNPVLRLIKEHICASFPEIRETSQLSPLSTVVAIDICRCP